MRSLIAAANKIDNPGSLYMLLSIKDVENVRRKYIDEKVHQHVHEDVWDQIIEDRLLLENALTLEMRKLVADVAKQEWDLL
eukprot:gene7308-8700_t